MQISNGVVAHLEEAAEAASSAPQKQQEDDEDEEEVDLGDESEDVCIIPSNAEVSLMAVHRM